MIDYILVAAIFPFWAGCCACVIVAGKVFGKNYATSISDMVVILALSPLIVISGIFCHWLDMRRRKV